MIAGGAPGGDFATWAPYAVAFGCAAGWPTEGLAALSGRDGPFPLERVETALAAPLRRAEKPDLATNLRAVLGD